MKTKYMPLQAEFYRTEKEWSNIYRRYAAKIGVPESRFQILYSIYVEDGNVTQSDICDIWGVPLQTINSSLKLMERDGIVKLVGDDGNRRKKHVIFTAEGEKLAEELIEPIIRAENVSFASLTKEEQTTLLELTNRQLTVLKEIVEKP